MAGSLGKAAVVGAGATLVYKAWKRHSDRRAVEEARNIGQDPDVWRTATMTQAEERSASLTAAENAAPTPAEVETLESGDDLVQIGVGRDAASDGAGEDDTSYPDGAESQ